MSRRYEFWIGRRYVRSRSSHGFISLISAISMLGIAIAVAVLIVVLSVVNGFERELTDRLLAMSAHATIEHPDQRLEDWPAWVAVAEAEERVAAAAPPPQATSGPPTNPSLQTAHSSQTAPPAPAAHPPS